MSDLIRPVDKCLERPLRRQDVDVSLHSRRRSELPLPQQLQRELGVPLLTGLDLSNRSKRKRKAQLCTKLPGLQDGEQQIATKDIEL